MKTEKLKLKTPKTSKAYGLGKAYHGFSTETSYGTDPTTTCTTVNTSTHILNV